MMSVLACLLRLISFSVASDRGGCTFLLCFYRVHVEFYPAAVFMYVFKFGQFFHNMVNAFLKWITLAQSGFIPSFIVLVRDGGQS